MLLQILGHPAQEGFRQGRVLNLPAPEDHGAFHLVSGLEEARGLADADVVIVLVNFVAHLDLLNFGLVRLLFGLLGLLFLFELVFSVVHDPADRRIGLFTHQHQVELALLGYLQSLLPVDHPQLRSVGVDHPQMRIIDALVDVGQLPHGSTTVKTGTWRHSGR